MRKFDNGVGGTCQEDMLTQGWLEDLPPYVRLDEREKNGRKGKGEREKGEGRNGEADRMRLPS
jgi:hypothetical protein